MTESINHATQTNAAIVIVCVVAFMIQLPVLVIHDFMTQLPVLVFPKLQYIQPRSIIMVKLEVHSKNDIRANGKVHAEMFILIQQISVLVCTVSKETSTMVHSYHRGLKGI